MCAASADTEAVAQKQCGTDHSRVLGGKSEPIQELRLAQCSCPALRGGMPNRFLFLAASLDGGAIFKIFPFRTTHSMLVFMAAYDEEMKSRKWNARDGKDQTIADVAP